MTAKWPPNSERGVMGQKNNIWRINSARTWSNNNNALHDLLPTKTRDNNVRGEGKTSKTRKMCIQDRCENKRDVRTKEVGEEA